ncbi:MAG TPA: hypothetical protein VK912_08660 [Longimicrobiales bacterium]|nr:hypothetical protein [Longimicrobiales bacterium]
MNRQSLRFFVAFLVSAAVVAWFVYDARPLYGLGAGFGGLLLHWALSRGGDRDGEVADSSYFFGFLLTLVFLTVGLYRLGVEAGAGGTVQILGFLEDLAAGLALTIAGLLIRQVRTLAGARVAGDHANDVQRQLADNLTSMIELWRARPEHQVLDVLEQSRSAARDAAQQLDRNIAAAGTRMLESVERLDQATMAATQSMTRAASGVSNTMSEMSQRLEVEIQHVLSAVQKAASQHEQQLDLWRTSLEHARTSLDQAHTGLDEQYRRSMEGFAASGEAFAQLAEKTTSYVEGLPNPAERLAGLWDGVRQLETDLIEAIGGSVMELGTLRERAEQLRMSLDNLGGSTDRTAAQIGSGGEKLAGSLQRELAQMNEIIEEYVALLEKTPRSLKVRA